jgi:uncharacterized protein DUF2272
MKAHAAILMLALVLGACAAKPPPIETITGKPIPPSEVKGTILRLTLGEWASFGKQRVYEEDGVEVIKPVGIWEDERAGAALVAKYWQLLDPDSKLTGYDCAQPWSAVFISWVMRRSGVDPTQFEKSAAHRDYLRRIIAHENDPAFKLKPRRAADYAPRPGDLICRGRGKDYGLSDYHDLGDDALLHCDIVVFNEGGVLQSVGGNVRQSVSMSERPVDAQGRLGDPWFVIENLYPEPGVPVAMM